MTALPILSTTAELMPNSPEANQDLPQSVQMGFCTCLQQCHLRLSWLYDTEYSIWQRSGIWTWTSMSMRTAMSWPQGSYMWLRRPSSTATRAELCAGTAGALCLPARASALSTPVHNQAVLRLMPAAPGHIRSLPAASSLCMQESLTVCTAGCHGLRAAALAVRCLPAALTTTKLCICSCTFCVSAAPAAALTPRQSSMLEAACPHLCVLSF